MVKKIIGFVCCFALLLTFTGCGTAVSQPKFNKKVITDTPFESLIAENENYILELNQNNMGITLTDKSSGEKFGSTPDSSTGEQFDELGMPIKKHPQAESMLLVEYLNADANTRDIAISYTDSVMNGRVRCKAIKDGMCVEFYFDGADFMIPVEYKLLDKGVKISVDPAKIQEGKNKVLKISLAPYWCAAENDFANSYLFIPSGSGALAEPITHSQQGYTYSSQVYGDDLAIAMDAAVSLTESVRMPVYGVKVGNNKATCGIIDGGAESAWIDLTVGSKVIGFSAVYASFQMRGYTNHTAKLFSSTTVENIVNSNLMISKPVSVTFYPLVGEEANYNGMARVYRDYLTGSFDLPKNCTDTAFNLNLIGGTMTTKSFLGVPYKTLLPTTDLKNALKIVSKLSSKINSDFTVNLKGFGETGIDNGKIGGNFEINKSLGSKKDLEKLISNCKNDKIDLYMNFDLIKFAKSGNGFGTSTDSVINAGEQKAVQYNYDLAVKSQLLKEPYYLLGPDNIFDASQKLIEKTKKLGFCGVSLDTLSSISYSDYADKTKPDFYSKSGFGEIAVKAINSVKKSGKKFLATDANQYAAVCADIITDVPTSSSGEYIFKCDVPFYAMVFKGHIPMTAESVNLCGNKDELLLKAVESGCGLNYTAIYKWDNSLINSPYSIFYNGVYSSIENDILNNSKKLSNYYKSISGAHIKSHFILENGLRETVFDNGVKVYVNYSKTAAVSPYGEVAALDYLVLESQS